MSRSRPFPPPTEFCAPPEGDSREHAPAKDDPAKNNSLENDSPENDRRAEDPAANARAAIALPGNVRLRNSFTPLSQHWTCPTYLRIANPAPTGTRQIVAVKPDTKA